MLRVVHVIGRMPGHGTQLQLAGMLRRAHGRLWDARLAVLRAGDPLAAEVARAGTPIVEYAGRDEDPRRLLWLRRLIDGADVIHSSLWRANVLARVVAGTRRRRPAVVISERSVEDFRPESRRRVDRVLRRWTEEYVANSRDVASFVARAHGVPADRITVIANGIDRSIFFPGTMRQDRHRPARLGTLGRLIPEKGLDVLLAAMPAILARQPVEVTVVGDGPERAALERMAEGLPVVFAGYLSEPSAVASFLRSLDVFVMPSRWEGLPNAVLEARACGTAVVATDVSGMLEAAGDQVDLVPPDQPEALADAVNRSLAAPGLPRNISVNSFEDVAAAHLAVFDRAVARRTRGQIGLM
jgi:glycosyltransferase involved in cell wall biosynthesis